MPLRQFSFKSLRFKILMFGACPVLITLLSISTLLIIQQFQELRRNIEEEINLNTSLAARQIEEANLVSVTIPKTMALAQENGLFGNREASTLYAQQVLRLNTNLTGAYFGYEPNADGQDENHSTNNLDASSLSERFRWKRDGNDKTGAVDEEGRFIPYWHRDINNPSKDGVEPLVAMESSLYYQGVKNRYGEEREIKNIDFSGYLSEAEQYLVGKDEIDKPKSSDVFSASSNIGKAVSKADENWKMMITEPYIYEGKLIFEQTYPIVISNKFKGIAGVDQALKDVQTFLETLKPFQSAGFVLISRGGRIIATTFDEYMTAKTDVVDKMKEAIRNAAELAETDEEIQDEDKSKLLKLKEDLKEGKIAANPVAIQNSRLADILTPFYENTAKSGNTVLSRDLDGLEYFYDSAKIPTGNWTLVMRVGRDEVYQPLRSKLWISAITVSIGGLFVTGILFWLANSIARRIALAAKVAEDIAQGDLTGKIDAVGGDEAGQLLLSITKMTGNLNALIGQVKQSSILLTSTATKISANAKTQESAVNEFGASTTEIAAAVKEITATSQELSKTMNSVTESASETATLADAGREGLEGMESAMSTLSEANSSISSKLAVISERAKNINRVVTTISKVADQTNLLSLNAAIEAEKAGEYGLGFSVVAREVRRLADQTAVATLDIDQMVKEMQSSVSAGVMEMDKFTEHMRQGSETVHNISTQLGSIIEHVQELTEQFETVRQGMNTQASGAQQINNAMGQLTDAAQSTSTSIVAFNQATSDLRDAVGGLREEVTKFKVDHD